MATQINHFVLIVTLLISVIDGASFATIGDWVNDFTSNLNRELSNMNRQINEQVAQINEDVTHLTENIQKNVEQTIQNLPRDAQGNIISVNDSSIITTSNGGTKIVTYIDGISRIVTSGRTPNGEPYVRDVVEKRIGDMLYHNETILNPKTGATETIAWKLNLAVPGAKPEIITDTKKDEK